MHAEVACMPRSLAEAVLMAAVRALPTPFRSWGCVHLTMARESFDMSRDKIIQTCNRIGLGERQDLVLCIYFLTLFF